VKSQISSCVVLCSFLVDLVVVRVVKLGKGKPNEDNAASIGDGAGRRCATLSVALVCSATVLY